MAMAHYDENGQYIKVGTRTDEMGGWLTDKPKKKITLADPEEYAIVKRVYFGERTTDVLLSPPDYDNIHTKQQRNQSR